MRKYNLYILETPKFAPLEYDPGEVSEWLEHNTIEVVHETRYEYLIVAGPYFETQYGLLYPGKITAYATTVQAASAWEAKTNTHYRATMIWLQDSYDYRIKLNA